LHLENKHKRTATALAAVRQELAEKSQSLTGLNQTLNAARSEAEKTDLALSTFMRSMSNELRTPLHSIIGFAEVMHDQLYGPLGDERYKDYVTFIRDSGHTLLSLVAQILELSRIQAGRYDLNLSHEQIDPILECCTAAIKNSALQRSINIELNVAPNLPKIWIDSLATQNIVDELLKNALAFTPDGGSVTISVNFVQSDLVIEVSDTGVGIAETDLDRVLFPFEKANNSISKERRGYGLGLSLAFALVNLQGGELKLISDAGKGTTASISLPTKTLQPASTGPTTQAVSA
jgi:signal transduction histidine kinase